MIPHLQLLAENFLLTHSNPCQFLCNVLNVLFRSPVKKGDDLQMNNFRDNDHLAGPIFCIAVFVAFEFCRDLGFSDRYCLSELSIFLIFFFFFTPLSFLPVLYLPLSAFLEDQCIMFNVATAVLMIIFSLIQYRGC